MILGEPASLDVGEDVAVTRWNGDSKMVSRLRCFRHEYLQALLHPKEGYADHRNRSR